MTITVRTTDKGRHIVETDGYDEGWQSLIQGAIACKVSLSASVQLQEDDVGWSGIDAETGMREPLPILLEKAERHILPGARVLQFRRIQ